MELERFYLTCLSHASYMIGSGGLAAVIDPQRDIGLYLEAAERMSARIAYVIETHLHADFVSGHRELAAITGAEIYLGARANAQFPHAPVTDGMEIQFGSARMRFLETPGHTVESISAVLTDLERGPEPLAVFTGDTLFIGDVGRPDLSGDLTPRELAGMLYDSLHYKLLTLPDSVLVYPAHGAGSLCGRQLSSDSSSTIGREKQTNYAVRAANKEEFARLLTSELPERPEYFARDVEINRGGAVLLEDLPALPALDPYQAIKARNEGAVVLDTRPAAQFGSGHIPGALHIGLAGQFASWAGTLIGLDTPIVLVGEEQESVEQARMRLARVGIERVSGRLADGMAAWTREGLPVEEVGQLPATELDKWMREGAGAPQVVDVRRAGEFEQGHIPGARLKPLAQLRKSLEDLDRGRPVVVNCKSGYRSSIGTSILQREGFREAMNLIGGFDAWKTCGLPCAVDGGPQPRERTAAGA